MKPLTEGKTLSNRKDLPKTPRPKSPPPPMKPTTKWSWDWPQKEGHYWAFGSLYEKKAAPDVALFMFKVYANSDGSFSYACNGGYFFKGLTGLLMWAEMDVPTMVPTPEIMYRFLYPHMFETGK